MPVDDAVRIVTLAYSNSAGYNNDVDKAEADVRGVYNAYADDPDTHLFGYPELIEHVPKVVVDKLFKSFSIKYGGTATSAKPKSSIPRLADTYMSSDHGCYQFGGTLVEPMIDPDTNVGSLHAITTHGLRHNLRKYFTEESEFDIRAIAEHILAKIQAFPVERIRNLVTTPTFRQDFSMVTVAGFDEDSRLYYLPDESLRTFTFTTDATKDRAKAGVDLIFELLSDFPFHNPDERYNYLAILLTLFLRSALVETHVPCLAIDGNGQSVGKGLLCSMLSLIAYGRDASFSSQPKSVEEWESKLDAILVSGSPFEVIDNIMNLGSVASGYFASILMSTNRSVRIKGLSKNVSVPVNVVWVINGNHLSLDGDLAQRVIMCHLKHPAPEDRNQEAFTIQKTYDCNIETLLARDRAKYMQACIDIICGWVNSGKPKRKKLKLAKYDTWESIVGGIMDWIAPEARFLANQKASHEMDSEYEETVAFLHQLIIEFPACGTKAIGASEIAAKTFPPPDPNMRSNFGNGLPKLRDVLPATLAQKTGSTFVNRLGKWLKAVSTKRWGTITLEVVEDTHNHRWTYTIMDATKSKTARLPDDDEAQETEIKAEPKHEAPPTEDDDDLFKNNPYVPSLGISDGPEHHVIVELLRGQLGWPNGTV